ncbi:MAG TPA: hypothetical protein VN522_14325 [Solirubrobacterales bacterium]|nr:hypothetical protein [Solirubrobacterales bacterium]
MTQGRLSKFSASLTAVLIAALSVTAVASAHTGEWAKFNYCPSTTAGVRKCLQAVTSGGEIVLGKKTVPIVHPVTLQGGFSAENEETGISTMFAATNGETLTKAAQAVPGGLLGIVPPEGSPPLVKALSAFFFENGLTGVNATLELAKPASEIQISQINLVSQEGVAMKLPVKVHLENPFLGKSCYIGSSTSPIIWNLTTGTTSPPAPNKPLAGFGGLLEFKEEAQIAQINGSKLVDNAWSAPSANGCGGILSFLVNPIINSQIGLPAAAGTNTSILNNTITIALAEQVNLH